MILYRKEETNLSQANVVQLDVLSEEKDVIGYLYLSRAAYDQALLLEDRFSGEMPILHKTLGCGMRHYNEVEWFFDNAPEPLYILAPFLGLIEESVRMEKDIEMLCGYLHMLSMTINFNDFTKVPESVRADVRMNKSQVMGYEKSWAGFVIQLKVEVKVPVEVPMMRSYHGDDPTSMVESLSRALAEPEEEEAFDLDAIMRAAMEEAEDEHRDKTTNDVGAFAGEKKPEDEKKEKEAHDIDSIINSFVPGGGK